MINHDDTRDCFHRCIMTRSICTLAERARSPHQRLAVMHRTPGQSPPTREEHMNSYLAIRVGCPTRIPLRPQHSKFFFHCFVNYVTCKRNFRMEWNWAIVKCEWFRDILCFVMTVPTNGKMQGIMTTCLLIEAM